MKVFKIILGIIVIVILYYYISKSCAKSNQFMHYQFSHSESKANSKEKGLFLTDKVQYIVMSDSFGIVKNSLDVWVDRMYITKQYGILPFSYTYENELGKNLEIEFKKDLDKNINENLRIRVNNDEGFWDKYILQSTPINNVDTVHIDFYYKQNKVSFGTAEVIYKEK